MCTVHARIYTHRTHLTCLIKTHPAPRTQRCECFPGGAGHVHFEKGRRFNFFFPPHPRLLIITEIAGMHDPENKAESWERVHWKHHHLQSDSPQSNATHTRHEWGRGSAPSPRERSSGTLGTLLQRAQLLRLRNKRKTKSQNGDWVGEKKNKWICCKLIGRKIQQRGRLTIKVGRQEWGQLCNFAVFHIIGQLNSVEKTWGHRSLFLKDPKQFSDDWATTSVSRHAMQMKGCGQSKENLEWLALSTVTFQLDIRSFHLPKPRSPVEQLPNRVISAVVSPDSRSRAREGARGRLLAPQWLLCALTFRAGWSMGLGRQCPCSGSWWGEGSWQVSSLHLLHHESRGHKMVDSRRPRWQRYDPRLTGPCHDSMDSLHREIWC